MNLIDSNTQEGKENVDASLKIKMQTVGVIILQHGTFYNF